MKQLILLRDDECERRMQQIFECMRNAGVDTMVLTDSANLYYTIGRVVCGWILLDSRSATARYFVKRPLYLEGAEIVKKPEEIASKIDVGSLGNFALELETSSYSAVERLKRVFATEHPLNASAVMREARSRKTDVEIEMIRESGRKQERAYSHIPKLYREGMTDLELQIEIERISRLEGCLGQFRISGDTMEIYMGNVLAGENADTPTPYDFAMGGAGINPSLPVGADGTTIREGDAVMIDMNGNYTGYMTDMTRVFSVGRLEELAVKAHQCSIDICHQFKLMARPGVAAKELYEMAVSIADEAGLAHLFMGHRQKAGFVGHGVGIEINESPVIAPRSRDILAQGNVIALEPKFVIPRVGAVGIENTYLITADGAEQLTNSPEEIIDLA